MNRFFFFALLSCAPAAASAHPGHGLPSVSHWHATDVLGFALAAGVVVGLIWWRGRK